MPGDRPVPIVFDANQWLGEKMRASVQVLKFGGTSVGNGERIRRVAHIIAETFASEEEAFPVVVVSAMAKVTDQLLRIAALSYVGEREECQHELATLKQKHCEAAEKVVHNEKERTALYVRLEEAFIGLERDVTVLATLVDSRESNDVDGANEMQRQVQLATAAVGAWGERLSVLLVAAAVADVGSPSIPVCEEIIITAYPDTEHVQPTGVVMGAEPLLNETRANAQVIIAPIVERNVIPIVAGFIGRTRNGIVTTLGRNGSDYSASVIGAAIDCVAVTIYTDVDGILTADPRLVMNTRLLPTLSYAEAARLSWFGAKVLHPRTLIPIAQRNIPIRVRNTFRPHTRGTVVGPEGRLPSGAAAITVRRHLALITVENTDLFGVPENAGQVFELAARAGAAPVAICSSSGQHLAFAVEEQAAEAIVTVLQHDMGNWRVRSRGELAACACIGSGFTVDPMSPARAITALARERIPVIAQGASELGISLIVADADSERALRCLHRDLIAPVIPLVRHTVQEKRRGAL